MHCRELCPEAGRFFIMELRNARAAALQDAEQFDQLLFAFERLGAYLLGKQGSLRSYEKCIAQLARRAPAYTVYANLRQFHTPFPTLYDIVRNGRNGAMHEGAYARHLVSHAIQLAIILEDALKAPMAAITDFMVRFPITAAPWHPLSYVRQSMLMNSFSFIPVQGVTDQPQEWQLISDLELARFLNLDGDEHTKARLSLSVMDAAQAGLRLISAVTLDPNTDRVSALKRLDGKAGLVVRASGDIIGIITPFDLL